MSAIGCPAASTVLARSPACLSPKERHSLSSLYLGSLPSAESPQKCSERPSFQKWRAMADGGAPAPAAAPAAEVPEKVEAPKPTMAKGNIVSVDKEKYLASVEYKAVDHPVYFKGLDYIYEARGEILDVRFFEAGEYCLVAWAGISTAPAWLPAYMLVKEAVLKYTRT